MQTLMDVDGFIGLAGGALTAATAGVGWTIAFLITAVVWPWRELTGRWPVVAYPTTGGPAADKKWIIIVNGKANADVLTQQWVEEIRARGEPVAQPKAP